MEKLTRRRASYVVPLLVMPAKLIVPLAGLVLVREWLEKARIRLGANLVLSADRVFYAYCRCLCGRGRIDLLEHCQAWTREMRLD